ncbi:tetratricopeptide repeat protein [Leptospirillum ferriphilum]|jgi:TPR repeat protein|uniref:Sel1 repeat family protein n=1 Tax=Leptospirillum ferriphilum YSK TaxID=1441628 RepID=A0A059Y2M8_9BACT|nr:tetratricopeptide repeat protein [Leptospirillum ferriphilum]AIA31737.1 hypothetical protein Y981_06800 [Leptospirillum ferriphilum YSK]OOH75414.1 hypothetical protein BOX30_11920 [Leptospirillum ferriphilum]
MCFFVKEKISVFLIFLLCLINLPIMLAGSVSLEASEICPIKSGSKNAVQYFQAGMELLNSHGPKKNDQRKAFFCFRESALLGYSWGEVWLGILYYKGMGVEKNRNKALRWWKKAAEQGNPWAQDRFNEDY